MFFIHLLTWAAAGGFASPVADHSRLPRNEPGAQPIPSPDHEGGEDGRYHAHPPRVVSSLPSSFALPTASSLPPSLALPTRSDFVIATPTPASSSVTSGTSNCTSTLYVNLLTGPYNHPTRTVHPTTVTSIYGVDCDGCQYLATVNIGGLGPVLQGVKTTTDLSPATVTKFACLG